MIAVLDAPDWEHGLLRSDTYRDTDFVDNATVGLESADAIAVIESSFLETEQRRPRGLEAYGLEATAIASPFSPVADLATAGAIHSGGVAAGAAGWRRYGAEPFEQFRADIEEFVACGRVSTTSTTARCTTRLCRSEGRERSTKSRPKSGRVMAALTCGLRRQLLAHRYMSER